jgi:L-ascorbate metabolism protein UlaG (beta-lactamase superfamily)
MRGLIREVSTPMKAPTFVPVPRQWNPNLITASWIGHASVLINFYGLTILTDPVLSRRIGPTLGPATLGFRRLVAPALRLKDLPPIELILLSHAHLDHLHLVTLNRFPATTKVITASGTADLLAGTKMKDVHELAWKESTTLVTHHGEIHVEAFEVFHWGQRWGQNDKKSRGYNGYILSRNNRKILFGGDTGYCDKFKALRDKGPFELAIMPIGSYKPGEYSHCTPEEAVAMANDAGAHYVLPIHHQTFHFGVGCPLEPIQRFEKALTHERIALRHIGETFFIS